MIDKAVGGGVDRSKLSKSDFVFPEDSPEGGFPVVTAGDVSDAVSSWGRYKGPHSFAEFKGRLTALAKRKGFTSSLPDSWSVGQDVTTASLALPVEKMQTRSHVRDAVKNWDGSATSRQKIIKRALALGFQSSLPSGVWKKSATQESASIEATLVLTQEGMQPQIVQEPSSANANVMRVRVPFYVSGSMNRPQGFSKKLYFPKEALSGLVQEGNRQINEGNQPLTVYARHAHAMSGDELPIGAVRGLEQEGRVGYATIDVAPTQPHGANAQLLIRNGMMNATSLRMGPGSYELGKGKVNGEEVLVLQSGSKLDGIDFAPNGPAQPTYGITILNEEARVEPLSVTPNRRRKLSEEITLEDVPQDVREAIERPLRDQLTALTQEKSTLQAERDLRARDDYLREIAAKTNDPEAGFKTLLAICNEQKANSRDAASTAVTPFLLQALEAATSEPKTPVKTPQELIKELFVTRTPSGSAISQEPSTEPAATTISQEEREYGTTLGGLLVPED